MSRTTVYQVLSTDADSSAPGSLGDIGLKKDNIYVSGKDTPEGEVFLLIRFGVRRRGYGGSYPGEVVVWAYDRNNDYLRIDRILKRIRDILTAVEARKTPEGFITTIRWVSESEDLSDDVYRASARNTLFEMVSSQV